MPSQTSPTAVRCIFHTGYLQEKVDTSYPFIMEANFRPPSLCSVAFIMNHGGSEIMMFQGMTVKALMAEADRAELSDHPRLRRIVISDRALRIVVKRKDSPSEPWIEG